MIMTKIAFGFVPCSSSYSILWERPVKSSSTQDCFTCTCKLVLQVTSTVSYQADTGYCCVHCECRSLEHHGLCCCSDTTTLDHAEMYQADSSWCSERAVLCKNGKNSHLSHPVLCFITRDVESSAWVHIYQWSFMKIILVSPLLPGIRFHSMGVIFIFLVFPVTTDNNLFLFAMQ